MLREAYDVFGDIQEADVTNPEFEPAERGLSVGKWARATQRGFASWPSKLLSNPGGMVAKERLLCPFNLSESCLLTILTTHLIRSIPSPTNQNAPNSDTALKHNLCFMTLVRRCISLGECYP